METLRDRLSVEDYALVLKVREAYAAERVRRETFTIEQSCRTLEAEVEQLRQEKDRCERAEGALAHQVYRNHEYSEVCDVCREAGKIVGALKSSQEEGKL